MIHINVFFTILLQRLLFLFLLTMIRGHRYLSLLFLFVLIHAFGHLLAFSPTTLSTKESLSSSFPLFMSGLFGELDPLEEKKRQLVNSSIEWQVYVDQSKASLDRGGSATLDAFFGLSPSSKVQVIPALLPKTKIRSPWIRIVATEPGRENIDVANVDSVDKVYRVLTKHLELKDVSLDTCDSLKWKYKGNSHLEAGKTSLAIDAYNQALAVCETDNKQEGVILLLRASAFLEQAQNHKQILQTSVQEWSLPGNRDEQALLLEASTGGSDRVGLANSVLNKLQQDGIRQQKVLRQIQYRHGLYQYALLHAAQDSLRATEILPTYSSSFLRAGEVLSELWKLKESQQYYEKALSLDKSLEDTLVPILQGLKRRQELLDHAKATREWPEDSLRLALDVAG